jgi:hypothetical protein
MTLVEGAVSPLRTNDEVNKLGRFDAEIHMRTSVSALAELMVRIHSPPAESLQTFGP